MNSSSLKNHALEIANIMKDPGRLVDRLFKETVERAAQSRWFRDPKLGVFIITGLFSM